MADLSFSAELKTDGFSTSLDRMEKGVQKFAKVFKILAGGAAIQQAISGTLQATSDYAATSSLAADAVNQVARAQERLNGVLAQGGIGLMTIKSEMIGLAAAAIETANPVSDFMADLFRGGDWGNAKGVREAQKGRLDSDALQRRLEAQKQTFGQLQEIGKESSRAFDVEVQSSDLAKAKVKILQDQADQLEKIDKLSRSLDVMQAKAVNLPGIKSAVNVAADVRRLNAEREDARMRKAKTDAAQFELQSIAIQQAGAQGQSDLVELLNIRLGLARKIQEIENDGVLTLREKKDLQRQYDDAYQELLASTKLRQIRDAQPQTTGSRTLGTGTFNAPQTFFGGPQAVIMRSQADAVIKSEKHLLRGVQVLENIQAGLQYGGGGAVLQ